jgi:Transposase DDE domain
MSQYRQPKHRGYVGKSSKWKTAKRGFVLLPRRWVVERSFAWITRFRRLARAYSRLPETLAGLHVLACVVLMLHRSPLVMAHASSVQNKRVRFSITCLVCMTRRNWLVGRVSGLHYPLTRSVFSS